MLGWRPSVVYKYLWKYVCLLAMLGLLGATTVGMFMKTPTYKSWNQEMVRSKLTREENKQPLLFELFYLCFWTF